MAKSKLRKELELNSLNPKTDGVEIEEPNEELMGYRLVEMKEQKFEVKMQLDGLCYIHAHNLPKELSGKYTSVLDAQKAIKTFLS